MKASGALKEFVVVGRRNPSATLPKPPLYQMTIYASDEVQAKSRFWYFIKRLKRVKKTNGELISIKTISERRPGTIKNYAVALRYDSRSGTHNMYREYRELTKADAVTAAYSEMAGRHRVRSRSLHIISVDAVPASKTRRVQIKPFIDSKIKFALPHRVVKSQYKGCGTFVAKRPNTTFAGSNVVLDPKA